MWAVLGWQYLSSIHFTSLNPFYLLDLSLNGSFLWKPYASSAFKSEKAIQCSLYGSHWHLLFSTQSQNPGRQGSIIIIGIFSKFTESQELGKSSSRQQDSGLTELSLDFLSCCPQDNLLAPQRHNLLIFTLVRCKVLFLWEWSLLDRLKDGVLSAVCV